MSTSTTIPRAPRHDRDPASRGRTFRSLQTRNYRLFFIGQLVSICGTWMQAIAQSTYVLYRLHGGGRQLGILSACQFVPVLVLGIRAGALIDRSPKRRILIAAQTLMGLSALVLTIAVVTGTLTFPVLCAIAFVGGIGNTFDMPARQAFVSEMVPPEDLQNAVGLNSAMFNGGRIVGQAIAGVLVSAIGYAWCFGINTASYAAIIVGYAAMRSSELRLRPPVERAKRQGIEGLRYVRRTPMLRTVLLLLLVAGTFSLNFQVFVPLIAKNLFHGTESKVATFQVIMAIGSLLGSLYAAQRSGPSGTRLLAAVTAFSIGLAGLALSHVEVLTWVLLFVSGASFMLFINVVNGTLQMSSSPAMRGRVMAVYSVVLVGTTPIGAPITGWVADTFGARTSIGVGALAGFATAAGAAVALRRGLLHRDVPAVVMSPAPSPGPTAMAGQRRFDAAPSADATRSHDA